MIAEERNRPDVVVTRIFRIAVRRPQIRRDPRSVGFLDETGARTDMARLYGCAPVGERVYGAVPFRKWSTLTFVAVLTVDGLIAPWAIDGPMNRRVFDACVETQLMPRLGPGRQVILDNLSVHKSPHAERILADAGCGLEFLPAYSPDLNPIEMAFSKLKAHLRRIAPRSHEELVDAIGASAISTPRGMPELFRGRGLRPGVGNDAN